MFLNIFFNHNIMEIKFMLFRDVTNKGEIPQFQAGNLPINNAYSWKILSGIPPKIIN